MPRKERGMPGEGDLGVRRVARGKGGLFEGNSEFSLVLPSVDKVAVIALMAVEFAAIVVQSSSWSTELHLTTIIAIAGLGGYNIAARRRLYHPDPDDDDPET